MPYCRACGIEVSPNTTYCPDCGEELNFGNTEVVEEPEETTVEETEPAPDPEPTPEPEPEPDTIHEPEPESEPEPTELDIEPNTAPEPESTGVSIWAKLGVVLAIPISLVGLYLEVASVYTLSIGGYTLGQFILMSILFGLVAFLPIAYIYWVYRRSTWSANGVLS